MIGFKINKNHSHDDYGFIVVKDGFSAPPPKPKLKTIEIPGKDGLLDITEGLTGEVEFEQRQIKIQLEQKLDNKYNMDRLVNDVNGQQVQIICDDDKEHFYKGRCTVEEASAAGRKCRVVLNIDADPFRYAVEETAKSFSVIGKITVDIDINGRSLHPTVTTTAPIKVQVENEIINFGVVKDYLSVLKLKSGSNKLILTGNGKIDFVYKNRVI